MVAWHVGYGGMHTVSLSEFPGDDALVSFSPEVAATGVSWSAMLARWNVIQAAWWFGLGREAALTGGERRLRLVDSRGEANQVRVRVSCR